MQKTGRKAQSNLLVVVVRSACSDKTSDIIRATLVKYRGKKKWKGVFLGACDASIMGVGVSEEMPPPTGKEMP